MKHFNPSTTTVYALTIFIGLLSFLLGSTLCAQSGTPTLADTSRSRHEAAQSFDYAQCEWISNWNNTERSPIGFELSDRSEWGQASKDINLQEAEKPENPKHKRARPIAEFLGILRALRSPAFPFN